MSHVKWLACAACARPRACCTGAHCAQYNVSYYCLCTHTPHGAHLFLSLLARCCEKKATHTHTHKTRRREKGARTPLALWERVNRHTAWPRRPSSPRNALQVDATQRRSTRPDPTVICHASSVVYGASQLRLCAANHACCRGWRKQQQQQLPSQCCCRSFLAAHTGSAGTAAAACVLEHARRARQAAA